MIPTKGDDMNDQSVNVEYYDLTNCLTSGTTLMDVKHFMAYKIGRIVVIHGMYLQNEGLRSQSGAVLIDQKMPESIRPISQSNFVVYTGSGNLGMLRIFTNGTMDAFQLPGSSSNSVFIEASYIAAH